MQVVNPLQYIYLNSSIFPTFDSLYSELREVSIKYVMYRWECNLQNQPIKKSAAIKSANPSFDMLHISQSECLKRSTTDGHTHGHYSRVSPVVPTDISAKSTLIVYWPYTLYLTSVYSVDYNKVMTWCAKYTLIVYWPSYLNFYLNIFGWLM